MFFRFIATIAGLLSLAGASEPAAADPAPLEYFAQRDAMRDVQLAPDGERLLKLAIPEADGATTLEVYETDDLAATPLRQSVEPWEISRANWVNNDVIVMDLRRRSGDGSRASTTRVALFDVAGNTFDIVELSGARAENILPRDPDRIIVSSRPESVEAGLALLPVEFSPRVYHQVELRSTNIAHPVEGLPGNGTVSFDADGSPWLARHFDSDHREYVWSRPVDDGWLEFFRKHEDSHETFNVHGPDPENPGYYIVGSQNGHDKIGIWIFDARNGKFGELIYRRNDVDVTGIRYDSNHWMNQGRIAGIEYFRDRYHYEYFDEVEAAAYAQIDGLIRNSYRTSIASRSADGDTMIVWNEAPSDPGSLYIVRNALLKRIGSRQPLLEGKQLAPVEYITYETRDNRELAAFLTRPSGEPPYPLVVMPHAGPFEQQTVIYDAWAQMLADNGFLVLQPQFRGSLGYGVEYRHAALVGGGQGGFAMQNDKDDGAIFLVRQGLADSERIAMFGWDYGGYAALVAASRAPQIYQCVAAAAAVPDTATQVAYYREHSRGHERRQHLGFWLDAINPADEVEQVNVPVLLIHRSDDRRVAAAESYRYVRALESAEKPYTFVELDGAGHGVDTLSVENTVKMFAALIDFLAEDCF